MSFHWQIVFVGPLTRWSKHKHPPVLIAHGQSPWLWLARSELKQAFKRLDPKLCGYDLFQQIDEKNVFVLEQYDPPETKCA